MRFTLFLLCLFIIENANSGSIEDIEHIVIFMQENRAYDEYYGTMRGVRGFNDRSAPLLPNGKSPFYQPINDDLSQYLLPYHTPFATTSITCMDAPTMDYYHDIHIWNNGLMDAWNTARSPGYGMSYFNRSDLPFYYALADNYLIGDNYFQSTFTATNPNRLHLFSGSNGLSVNSTFDVLDDSEPDGIDWITMAEILQQNGISWRVYQEKDNFDDNAFAWFDNFKNAKPGSDLYDLGMYRANNLIEEFGNDVRNGNLPSVSWIVGPTNASEHATNHPQNGENLSAQLIKIFSESGNASEIYKKTVFILNYDEGGQFYDHLWSPTAPMNSTDGKSTVTIEGEKTKQIEFNIQPGNPIGPAFRVPFFIISPWTRAKGGIVFSELTDHTSVLKLIEKRFNITIPNISPWRRSVMSDLTYTFDFDNPNYDFPDLPDTSNSINESEWECIHNPKPIVPLPHDQFMPTQEEGTKISRKLPYYFETSDIVNSTLSIINISMINNGDTGVVFHVHNYSGDMTNPPKKYSIEQKKQLWDTWKLNQDMSYNLSLYGPNGYVRGFAANNVFLMYNIIMKEYGYNQSIVFEFICNNNQCDNDKSFMIIDYAYGNPTETVKLNGGKYYSAVKSVESSGNWYDYMIEAIDQNGNSLKYQRRFMGRIETGKDSITDPAMAIPKIDDTIHPNVDWYFEEIFRTSLLKKNKNKEICYKQEYGFTKDQCWDVVHKY